MMESTLRKIDLEEQTFTNVEEKEIMREDNDRTELEEGNGKVEMGEIRLTEPHFL